MQRPLAHPPEVIKLRLGALASILSTPGVRQRRHIDCANLATLRNFLLGIEDVGLRHSMMQIPAYKREYMSKDNFLVVDEATEVRYRLEMKQ